MSAGGANLFEHQHRSLIWRPEPHEMSGGLVPGKWWLSNGGDGRRRRTHRARMTSTKAQLCPRSARWPTRTQVENSHCTRVIDGTAVAVNSEPAIPVDSRPLSMNKRCPGMPAQTICATIDGLHEKSEAEGLSKRSSPRRMSASRRSALRRRGQC